MIVNDAPAIFTTHSLSFVLVQPSCKGISQYPIGISGERYMWLDGNSPSAPALQTPPPQFLRRRWIR